MPMYKVCVQFWVLQGDSKVMTTFGFSRGLRFDDKIGKFFSQK
jgi:hypothetical protein